MKIEKSKLIVLGGGPAGFFCSIFASEKGVQTTLLEKMNKVGKKILVAGKGQCNLTHELELKEFFTRYGDNGKFLKKALYNFKKDDLFEFFKRKKLPLTLVESGKYFPETFSSVDVVNLLSKEALKNKTDIICNVSIEKIEKIGDFFEITTKDVKYISKYLLIATGGKSYPLIGTTGDGYIYAKELGHKIIPTKPCLTPVYIKDYPFTEISGISFKMSKLDIYKEGKKISSRTGDILFTHKNLSGPLIIDSSRYIEKNTELVINFLNRDINEVEELILKNTKENGKKSLKRELVELKIPDRFTKLMLKLLGISDKKKLAELGKQERKEILKFLCEYRADVTKLEGWDKAMATTGGVSLKEVNPKTMESKLVENLYFAGEVLDIDGDTGGFNIQGACSMGVLVAKSILDKELKNGTK